MEGRFLMCLTMKTSAQSQVFCNLDGRDLGGVVGEMVLSSQGLSLTWLTQIYFSIHVQGAVSQGFHWVFLLEGNLGIEFNVMNCSPSFCSGTWGCKWSLSSSSSSVVSKFPSTSATVCAGLSGLPNDMTSTLIPEASEPFTD